MVEERLMIVLFDLSQKTIRLVDSCEKKTVLDTLNLKLKDLFQSQSASSALQAQV